MPVSSFVLNDQSRINSHGFILLNSGGNFQRFNDNPVMFLEHDRTQLVGRWGNLRIEGDRLLADPVFDTDDDLGKRTHGRVERGFLKGGSPGVYIESAELRDIPGMGTVPVVTKWELMEGSVVSVPSNPSSLMLYNKEGLCLSSEDVTLSLNSLIKPKKNHMETLLTAEAYTALGLDSGADGKALSAAITELSAQKKAAETALSEFRQQRAKSLVEGAIKDGRIKEDKKEKFLKLATDNYELASELLPEVAHASAKPKKTLSEMATRSADGEDRSKWNYMKWLKEDPTGLSAMDVDEREALKAAFKRN